jgi:hypothetical protein
MQEALEHPYIHASSDLSSTAFACSCGRKFSAHSACVLHAQARRHAGKDLCMVHVPSSGAAAGLGSGGAGGETCASGIGVLRSSALVGLCGDRGGRRLMEDQGGATDRAVVVADGHLGGAVRCARLRCR